MKKVLRLLWNEFIYGGHLVALGPTIIIFVCIKLLELPVSYSLLVGIYLVTYTVHVFDRYQDIGKDSSGKRVEHFNSYKNFIPIFIALSLLVVYFFVGSKNYTVFMFTIFLVLAGFGYSLCLKKLTRYIVGFKSFYVAIIFASVVFFMASYYNLSINSPLILLFVFFAFRWFANTVFCDIKDKKQDQLDGLKTFALTFKENKFYLFLISINILSVTPVVIGVYFKMLPVYSLMLVLVTLYYFYYMRLAQKKSRDIQELSNVWADGESVIWFLLVLTGGKLWGL